MCVFARVNVRVLRVNVRALCLGMLGHACARVQVCVCMNVFFIFREKDVS